MSIINTRYHSWQSIVERVLGPIAYANIYELKIERDTLDMTPMRMILYRVGRLPRFHSARSSNTSI